MVTYYRLSVLVLVFSIFTGCGGSSSPAPVVTPAPKNVDWTPVSTDTWSVGDAAQENFNIAQLNTAFNNAESASGMKSLLVIRNDQLIAEAYFDDTNADSLLQLMSVTKTLMAMLIGIAIDEGYLSGLEQTIGSFFETDYPLLSEPKKAINLFHLLTMTSGFQWDEGAADGYLSWVNSADPQGYLLSRELVATPGNEFNYNSASSHLLSVILSKATGMSTMEYANQKLFQPLGINQFAWQLLADNINNGGAGLELRASDLAKIGLLIHKDGDWQQQIIIPDYWVQQAKTVQFNLLPGEYTFLLDGYGYLLWLGSGNNQTVQLAWGWGGQFIAIIPEKNMVVVVHSEWEVDGATAISQYQDAFEIILNQIVNAAN